MRDVVVAGSGSQLWKEVSILGKAIKLLDTPVVCVNHTALYWPFRFNYVVSIHAEMFEGEFLRTIKQKGAKTVSSRNGADINFKPLEPFLDSGLLATLFALNFMKAERVFICGIPLDNQGKFYEDPEVGSQVWQDNIFEAWQQNEPAMRGKVYSMSGKTRDLLGEPLEVLHHGVRR